MRAECEQCGEGITFVLDRGRFLWVHDAANPAPLYVGGRSRHHARPVKETIAVA